MNQKNEALSQLSDTIPPKIRRLLQIGINTYQLFANQDMNVFSGNATFYILMALVPFVALAAGLINYLPPHYLKDFCEILLHLFPNIPQIQYMLNELLEQVSPQKGTLVVSISLIVLLWSASNGVSALQIGMMRISGTRQSAIRQRLSAMVYTVLFILLIAALLIFRVFRSSITEIGIAISNAFENPKIMEVLNAILEDGGLITVIAMGLVVVLTYTFLQGEMRQIRKQLPGALFTIVLWIVFSSLFEWFISKFWDQSAVYGSLASIFLTAMWLKTIITILFLGGALNEVLFRKEVIE